MINVIYYGWLFTWTYSNNNARVLMDRICHGFVHSSRTFQYFGHTFPQLWSSSTVSMTRMTTLVLNSRTGKQYYPVLRWKLLRQLVVFPVSVTFALYSVVSLNRCLGQTISLVASTSSQAIPARFKISSHSEITGWSPVNEKNWRLNMWKSQRSRGFSRAFYLIQVVKFWLRYLSKFPLNLLQL